MKNMNLRTIGIATAILVLVAMGIYVTMPLLQEKTVVKVFCAGSLAIPLEKIEEKFESDKRLLLRNVDVQIETAGSVKTVKKVTDVGKIADVVASADYTLIPSMMFPDYADWYIQFARNRMVLAYSESSRYADEINSQNWYAILRRDDVKWGFSNPNLDPCGYRTPMVIQLAEFEYGDDSIFEDLIVSNSAITISKASGTYTVMVPEDLNPNTSRLTIRDKSVALVSLVQEGGLDYAFEYMSVAKQHDLKFVELPTSVDLSDVEYTSTYNKVKIQLSSGKVQTGKPIVYGVTVPKNAVQKELAEEFVEYMINESGRETFSDLGQPPISPAVANDLNLLPESLRKYCTE